MADPSYTGAQDTLMSDLSWADTLYQAVPVPVPVPVSTDGGLLSRLFDFSMLYDKMGIMISIYFVVLLAITVDFFTGIRRAKRMGVVRTSTGYKRTVGKFNRYYSLLLLASMIDSCCLLVRIWEQVGILSMPYVTGLGGIFLCTIELRSVWENTQDKARGEVADTAMTIAKAIQAHRDPERLVKILIGYLEGNRTITKKNDRDDGTV